MIQHCGIVQRIGEGARAGRVDRIDTAQSGLRRLGDYTMPPRPGIPTVGTAMVEMKEIQLFLFGPVNQRLDLAGFRRCDERAADDRVLRAVDLHDPAICAA